MQVQIFDLSGRLVEILVEENKPAGSYSIDWDAHHLASGTYFIRLKAEDVVQVRKCVLLK